MNISDGVTEYPNPSSKDTRLTNIKLDKQRFLQWEPKAIYVHPPAQNGPKAKASTIYVALKEGVIGHENQANAAKLFGSRLFGRWPSGTPLEKQPAEYRGVPEDELNSFDYKKVKSPNCPFAAHIRKTNPRNDLPGNFTVNSSIVRAGIPYGEEIKEDSQEKRENRTIIDRGLAFVAYQSIIKEGFIEQQKQWANNPDFPPTPLHEIVPGFDGIIGQNNKPGDARVRNGIDGLKISKDFVHPRAGCYFFVPSIPALHEYFSG
ncbi:hypothetical protein RHS04_06868 [Rhizoctonia solani]|uniref:Dyp-type peroxidase C-terminal domain-containing protein n=1 Tax=Rhizoctonia solani TaxID=456999 RepID=A0A8H7H6M6_9AGAM|nr:hypothetical protein RHS04_06868 [Rhizoctonia solani]